ncbi:lipopolysaccharide export LptBFGC system permease protein LptF [Brevibacillus aydinogluensis]|jgi:lipopolysaccharide export LptBFGC system permease protein LptF|nr:lipopolysaccharide export LptBFGC system permease protein LptF [Brevibacillus aydinogluensis]
MFRNKIYWMLLPPFLAIAVILAFWLPPKQKPLTLLVVIVFWAVYYLWDSFDKNLKSNKQP